MKPKIRLLSSAIAAVVVVVQTSHAQVPQQLNYQGRVTVQGVNFNGTGEFKFALVDAGENQNQTATASAFATLIVTSISLESGGSGYVDPPAVTISPPDDPEGVQATATATISDGSVTGIAINVAGSGYLNHPQVTIDPPPPNIVHNIYWSNSGDLVPGDVPGTSVPLPVTNGLYSVRLGDPSFPNMSAFFVSEIFYTPLFLRVWFDDGVHGLQQLTPDQPLASAPYALHAGLALSAAPNSISSTQIVNGAVTSSKLAAGAAAANLASASQSPVPTGGIVLSSNATDTLLAGNGYAKLGRIISDEGFWDPRSTGPMVDHGYTTVWTGGRWVTWGGYHGSFEPVPGKRYLPADNIWTPVSETNAPAWRYNHSAVGTGTEMIVWGGYTGSSDLGDGARYNPATDTWITITSTGAPLPREQHAAVWAGDRMIIWGGLAGSLLVSGGCYFPGSNTWVPTSTVNAPVGRVGAAAVWTGTKMVIWGGEFASDPPSGTGGSYDPVADTWTSVSLTGAPSPRRGHAAVWTGTEMIVWGGYLGGGSFSGNGARYNPLTNQWTAMSSAGAPSARSNHTAVWTGQEMIVWGGFSSGPVNHNDGASYDPVTDRWSPLSTEGTPPSARTQHKAVWTGSEMLIHGGYDGSGWSAETHSHALSRILYLYQRQ